MGDTERTAESNQAPTFEEYNHLKRKHLQLEEESLRLAEALYKTHKKLLKRTKERKYAHESVFRIDF